jgi:hypothetical protein
MTLRVFIYLRSKRAETITLLDLGATENFMNIRYAQKMELPIRWLTEERRLFNVDGTLNKAGSLKYYTNVTTRTGEKTMHLWYFLTDLGENQVILGYPWFTSAQPRINWAKGWIDYTQLPIVLRSDDADWAIFSTKTRGRKAVIKTIQVDERSRTNTGHLPMSSAMKNQRNYLYRDHGTTRLNSNQGHHQHWSATWSNCQHQSNKS